MLCIEEPAVQAPLLAHFLHRGKWFRVLAARQCVETGLYHLLQQSKFLNPIGCVRVPRGDLGGRLDLGWSMGHNAQPPQFAQCLMRKGVKSAAIGEMCCTRPYP